MCGICGAVQLEGPPGHALPAEVLDRMTDALTHRGPDDRGTYRAPGIALGVRRLAIVDPRDGHQPTTSEDGSIVAVQNGELYNHLDLRRVLSGHVFRSRCDTEVLPHLYEHVGAELPARLRGKFALAVWDGRARRLLLARDRLGVKPLYTAEVGGLLLFSSELKSLLASGLVPAELDYGAIDAYLNLGFVPGPLTPLRAVAKLGPGELLLAGPAGLERRRYWHYPEPEADPPPRAEAELAEELLELLEESVRLRLMSDVPLGAMLSGGLDSSLIVALMARNMSDPVKTFSVGFSGEGWANELDDARRVAALYGCDHHQLELSAAEQTIDPAELAWALDEPLADLSALGFLALSQLASRHVTVALSGQGADELLGGYQRYRTAAYAERLRRVPGPARRATARAAAGTRFARAARVVAADGAAAQWLAAHDQVSVSGRGRLVRGPLSGYDGGAAHVAGMAAGLRQDGLRSLLYLDGRIGLVDDMLHYFDRTSMARSIEVRVPFLDHELVEWCARVPARLKVHGAETKVLLKRAARGLVPDEIVDKPKIGFLHGAAGGWLRSQLAGPMHDHLLGEHPAYADLLDRAEVERLVREHGEGRGDSGLLLAILMLEVWLSTYLPRALAHPPPAPLAPVAG
jgi:asparagine synthase (glutamine-hydrolysing)